MGEAKRRGTKEQRIKQAKKVGRTKHKRQSLLDDMSLIAYSAFIKLLTKKR